MYVDNTTRHTNRCVLTHSASGIIVDSTLQAGFTIFDCNHETNNYQWHYSHGRCKCVARIARNHTHILSSVSLSRSRCNKMIPTNAPQIACSISTCSLATCLRMAILDNKYCMHATTGSREREREREQASKRRVLWCERTK
jgi:hypothetical protein